MQYTNLGKTGVRVSALCLGTMTFGAEADEQTSSEIYATARDAGINFFDCANGYAGGASEQILGKLVHNHRDEVLVASKVYFPTGKGVNQRGLSRFHMTKALDASLKRLNTDYLDVYYLHHFDSETDLFETLSTLNDFVRQGKVLYIGISNFSAWQTMKAVAITQSRDWAPISCVQPMYNLIKRQAESEILPLAQSEGLGVFSYSPLAGGLLTGKYIDKAEPVDGRFDTNTMYQKRYEHQVNTQVVSSFNDFCQQRKLDPVATAISWVAAHDGITAPIIGARNIAQLKPALDAAKEIMTSELRSEISALSLAPALATDREEER